MAASCSRPVVLNQRPGRCRRKPEWPPPRSWCVPDVSIASSRPITPYKARWRASLGPRPGIAEEATAAAVRAAALIAIRERELGIADSGALAEALAPGRLARRAVTGVRIARAALRHHRDARRSRGRRQQPGCERCSKSAAIATANSQSHRLDRTVARPRPTTTSWPPISRSRSTARTTRRARTKRRTAARCAARLEGHAACPLQACDVCRLPHAGARSAP